MTKALPIALLLMAPLAQPSLAIEDSQKNALTVVTGMYGAADALCKNYLVNLQKVVETLIMLDVPLQTPKAKALYLQGHANFEKQVRD